MIRMVAPLVLSLDRLRNAICCPLGDQAGEKLSLGPTLRAVSTPVFCVEHSNLIVPRRRAGLSLAVKRHVPPVRGPRWLVARLVLWDYSLRWTAGCIRDVKDSVAGEGNLNLYSGRA